MNTFEATLRELLASGQSARFRAEGDSMYPAIRSGEMVEIAPCDVTALRPGEIVLAKTARGLTLHRIVRVSSRGIVLRGDNAVDPDGAVLPANVLGKATNSDQMTNDWRSLDTSVKIIRIAAAFARRLRSRFQRQFSSKRIGPI